MPESICFIMHLTCWGSRTTLSCYLNIRLYMSIGPYSSAKNNRFFKWNTSWSLTMFGWSNSWRSLISRSRENSKPSSPITIFCFFTATRLSLFNTAASYGLASNISLSGSMVWLSWRADLTLGSILSDAFSSSKYEDMFWRYGLVSAGIYDTSSRCYSSRSLFLP